MTDSGRGGFLYAEQLQPSLVFLVEIWRHPEYVFSGAEFPLWLRFAGNSNAIGLRDWVRFILFLAVLRPFHHVLALHQGDGLIELKVESGPGYRIYIVDDGRNSLILCAGSKRTQKEDIQTTG